MPVPKKRHPKSRRDKRRAHLKLKAQNFSLCPKCNHPLIPHRACPNCGYYQRIKVVDVLAKLKKKERKKKEEELKKTEEKRIKEKPLSLQELSRK